MHRLINQEAEITFADLFAGGGGVTSGAISIPGIKVKWALNHSKAAIKCHAKNHPETKHYQADIRTQDVSELEKVDILWASTECTQHSKAKGGADKEIGSYTLGWEILRYIVHCEPKAIHIENVPEFMKWSPVDENGKPIKSRQGEEFQRWVNAIRDLGYVNYEHRFLNAADFGCPTRRLRYFGIFTKAGLEINWPTATNNEKGTSGLEKWKACREFLNLENEGVSIFGREFNEQLPKQHRHPLSANTVKRIVGGIRKFAPEMYMLMTYHGSGHNCHSIDLPISTIGTVEAKVLLKIEKLQFITDHCHTANYNTIDEPVNPQLTRETKQLISLEAHFIDDSYGRLNTAQPVDKPSSTVTCANSKRLVTAKAQFISKYYGGNHANGKVQHHCQSTDIPFPTIKTVDGSAIVTAQFISKQYNSNGNPEANNQDIESPIGAITVEQKMQFISAYFNSSGHPESQNQSVELPLNTILTETNKKALVTPVISDREGLFDFDIKMRFLDPHTELAPIMGFPKDYFDGFSKKSATKMIGNAVPTGMAKVLIEATKEGFEKVKESEIYL